MKDSPEFDHFYKKYKSDRCFEVNGPETAGDDIITPGFHPDPTDAPPDPGTSEAPMVDTIPDKEPPRYNLRSRTK